MRALLTLCVTNSATAAPAASAASAAALGWRRTHFHARSAPPAGRAWIGSPPRPRARAGARPPRGRGVDRLAARPALEVVRQLRRRAVALRRLLAQALQRDHG